MSEEYTFKKIASTVNPLLAILTFAWGIYTYKSAAAAQLEKDKADARRTSETRRIEATRPFLDKQLDLYTRITKLAATIATHGLDNDRFEFTRLYWGEMGLVEGSEVEQAMAAFQAGLDAKAPEKDLARSALTLAHACRKELAQSWGTDAWLRTPAN